MAFSKLDLKYLVCIGSSKEWKTITYHGTLVLVFLSQFTLVLFSIYVNNATGSCKLSAIFVVTRLASLSVNLQVSSKLVLGYLNI